MVGWLVFFLFFFFLKLKSEICTGPIRSLATANILKIRKLHEPSLLKMVLVVGLVHEESRRSHGLWWWEG